MGKAKKATKFRDKAVKTKAAPDLSMASSLIERQKAKQATKKEKLKEKKETFLQSTNR